MSEPRPVFLLVIGLMLCLSLWRISVQEPNIVTEYSSIETVEMNSAYNKNPSSSPRISANNDSSNQAHHTIPMPTTQIDLMPKDDENRLIDLNNFQYLIDQPLCHAESTESTDQTASETFIVILVHSAPGNWRKRNVIRDTWGQQDSRARLFFLLGAVNTTSEQHHIRQENDIFQDIIQGNFLDAYRNMTYKHVMALKWFVYNCPKLKYLVKTDDDVFVNTPAVYNFLEQSGDKRNFLFCYKLDASPVKRSYRSKWRVSTKEYSGWYYPQYCPGFSIIYSADVVYRLYQEAQRTRYFWIDDVHVTGTLAQQININITAFGKYYMTEEQRDSLFNGNSNLMEMEPMFLFTQPNLAENQIKKLWKLILMPENNNHNEINDNSTR